MANVLDKQIVNFSDFLSAPPDGFTAIVLFLADVIINKLVKLAQSFLNSLAFLLCSSFLRQNAPEILVDLSPQ